MKPKTDPTALNPRQVAVRIAERVDRGQAFADDLLQQMREDGALDARDQALVRRIVLGTLRRKLTLDCILAVFSDRPIHRIQSRTRQVLRTALYQILFLDRVPASAATDEAVKLAGPRAGGFVNAVLRSCTRALVEKSSEDPARSLQFAARPYDFNQPVFPHPADDRLNHLEAIYSHPASLIERLERHYTTAEVEQVLAAGVVTPGLYIRINTQTGSVELVQQALEAAGYTVDPTEDPQVVRVDPVEGLFAQPAFLEGRFQVQDLSAAQIAPLLEPGPGEAILDACAAPGGKTTHLAQLSGDRARIVACDISAPRLEGLAQNLLRLKIQSVTVQQADMENPPEAFLDRFDKVLLDAPCTNSGVLARRPEARYRITSKAVSELTALQGSLLEGARRCVRAGGLLVYSTCSVLPEENDEVVAEFLASHRNFSQTGNFFELPRPGRSDGAYGTQLKRLT